MYFKYSKTYLIFFHTLLIASWQTIAEPSIEEFSIKPELCIVEKGKHCKQSFIFYWRLSKAIPACLYQTKNLVELHCETSKEVELIKTLDLKLSNTFILKTADTQVERDVSVRQLTTDIRQVRRHVWSVF